MTALSVGLGLIGHGCATGGALQAAPSVEPANDKASPPTRSGAAGEVDAQRRNDAARASMLESHFTQLQMRSIGRADAVAAKHLSSKAVIDHEPLGPIDVSPEDPKRPVPVRDGYLVLPGGLRIHRVPPEVCVEARGGRNVWDIEQHGTLVARVHAVSFGRAAHPQHGSVFDRSRPTRVRMLREDWAPLVPVEVVVERFSGDTHLYTLERRVDGTDWIWAGLELGHHASCVESERCPR